jgi:hypothetical protein
MSEIKRWTLKGTGACLLGDKDGEWCYYESAQQRIRELEQELDSETRRFSARCMELERIIESRVPRAEE